MNEPRQEVLRELEAHLSLRTLDHLRLDNPFLINEDVFLKTRDKIVTNIVPQIGGFYDRLWAAFPVDNQQELVIERQDNERYGL
jgi:hypothetical protein